jgi:mannose/fructose/N-acetylgalactosamine-specific phosphotransferase system component IIB
MNLVLARIDDRLIHGQVTVGWGRRLRPDHILLASDEVAADPWQIEVYRMSVPPEIGVSVVGIDAAAHALREPARFDLVDRRVLLLVATAPEMKALVDGGAPLGEINLGGLHYARGKRELLPDMYIDRADLDALRGLVLGGHELFVQAVPGSREVRIEPSLLEEMENRL